MASADAADAPPPAPQEEELVLPMVDEKLLEDVKSMGFPELRARKALMAGSKNVESALDWLLNHENDGDIDEPIKKVPKGQTLASSGPAPVAKSIKCVETGRLFRNAMEAQAYADEAKRAGNASTVPLYNWRPFAATRTLSSDASMVT